MKTDKIFNDLLNVGPHKPIGYLPMMAFHSEEQLKNILLQLILKNLTVTFFPENESLTASGALYVWDYKALTKHLNKNKNILLRSKWPITADAFVRHLFNNTAPGKTQLFNVIADAFNDKHNLGRKWSSNAFK